MNPQLRPFALPIAKHEFGHYVASRHLFFQAGPVTITINSPQDISGNSTVKLNASLKSICQAEGYLKNRIIILYAGVLAQCLEEETVHNGRAICCSNTNGASDAAKARELIHILRSMRYPDETAEGIIDEQLASISQECWKTSTSIVETHALVIYKLSNALLDRYKQGVKTIEMSVEELQTYSLLNGVFRRVEPTD